MARIAGTGINVHELRLNRQLSDFAPLNLNVEPRLPYANGVFDVVTCVNSVEYLTRPLAVFREVSRVLKPGGKFIVSISNRCFPSKVVRMWLNTDTRQHCLVVAAYFHYALGWVDMQIVDISPPTPVKLLSKLRSGRDSLHIIQATTAVAPLRHRRLVPRTRGPRSARPDDRRDEHELRHPLLAAVTALPNITAAPSHLPVRRSVVNPAPREQHPCCIATPVSLTESLAPPPPPLSLMVAICANTRGIGVKGSLPWALCADMEHFQNMTLTTNDRSKRNAVVMGRRTWVSIPECFRPLAGRFNVVLSRRTDARDAYHIPESVLVVSSLEAALRQIGGAASTTAYGVESIFVIGGAAVYAAALARPELERVHVTEVLGAEDVVCDSFFPSLEPLSWRLVRSLAPQQEGNLSFRFLVYERAPAAASAINRWQSWIYNWREALSAWWLALSADAAASLRNCAIFLGGVLSSRFDSWILLPRLGLRATTTAKSPPPPPRLRLPTESCDVLVKKLGQTLPEFPAEPSEFMWLLPPLFRKQFPLLSKGALSKGALPSRASSSETEAAPNARAHFTCSLSGATLIAGGFVSGMVAAIGIAILRTLSPTCICHTHLTTAPSQPSVSRK